MDRMEVNRRGKIIQCATCGRFYCVLSHRVILPIWSSSVHWGESHPAYSFDGLAIGAATRLGMKLSIKLAFRQQFTWLKITRKPGGIADDEWLSLKRSKYPSSR
jgi:hypothetical protein